MDGYLIVGFILLVTPLVGTLLAVALYMQYRQRQEALEAFRRSQQEKVAKEENPPAGGMEEWHLGPLYPLINDATVSEIMVNRYDLIFVERNGKVQATDLRFRDNNHLLEVIRRVVSEARRRIDESSPMVDARLADGSRVNAIIPPIAISGPSITIRKFASDAFTMEDLVREGSLSPDMAEFLHKAVRSKKNIVVAGGSGAGKTTLLNVLMGLISAKERLVTIEDAAELKAAQSNVVSLEARPPNIEGMGAIPIRQLLVNALRMRPDRIIVGECRGAETLDMLQAMNTGHDGSLTTIHANTPKDALTRLEMLVLMAGMELPASAVRQQIAASVDLIVQAKRLADGSRRIVHIAEVVGYSGDAVRLNDLFFFRSKGTTEKGRIEGEFVKANDPV